jgi:hypothetical protein
MKEKMFFMIFLFAGLNSLAQNVGIGTTAPTQKLEVAGNTFVRDSVGIGVPVPQYKLDVAGRMRIRSEGSLFGTAGLWLNNTDNSTLPAFIGMASNNQVGIYSNTLGSFGLLMNTSSGNVNIGGSPSFDKLYVNGSIGLSGTISTENPKIMVLAGNWFNAPFPFYTPTYFKDKESIVHLAGTIKCINAPTSLIITSLPNGYWPLGTVSFAVPNGNGFVRIDIAVNGVVTLFTTGLSTPTISLDGITYRSP